MHEPHSATDDHSIPQRIVQYVLVQVCALTYGIASGKPTACPLGFPYDAQSFAINLLVEIPADSVKPSKSKTSFLMARAIMQPRWSART